MLLQEGGHEDGVHPQLTGGLLQPLDFHPVDLCIHRSHGKQGVQQQQRIRSAIAGREAREVELFRSLFSEDPGSICPETQTERPQPMLLDRAPELGSKREVDQCRRLLIESLRERTGAARSARRRERLGESERADREADEVDREESAPVDIRAPGRHRVPKPLIETSAGHAYL